jgi:polyisoprenoid-binding protein YceI
LAITPGTYTVDPVHSSIGFTVRHNVVAKFRGSFDDFAATLVVDEDGKLHLTGTVKVASVNVKEPNLAGHLQSPDFFDAERFPEITFTSVDLEPGADGALTAAGDLTMKGVTKRVEATGEFSHLPEDSYGGERAGVELTTTINRYDFGINWNATLPSGHGFALAEHVTLEVELELKKS